MRSGHIFGLLVSLAVLLGDGAAIAAPAPADATPSSTTSASPTPSPPLNPNSAQPAVPLESGKPTNLKQTPPDLAAASESGSAFAGDANLDPDQSVILDNADTFEQNEPGQWIARGNVKVRYRGYTLTSDRADVDLDTGDAVFTGHPILRTPRGDLVEGQPVSSVRLNMRDSTYTIIGARSTISPQTLAIGIILPIIVSGGTISGRPGFIDARNSSFTTCDFPSPHYYFQAAQLYIIPGKHLVGKHVTLYRKNRKIITIPYFYAPLDKRFSRQTLVPQVGQTPDEGYFAKFAIGYALASSLPGILRLDAMQKKGLGTGFEQNYGSIDAPKRGSGLLSMYHLRDRNTGADSLTGTLNHTQHIGTVVATLTSSLQDNSYQAGDTRSSATTDQLSLTRNVGNLNSSFRTSLSNSDYGVGNSQSLTSSFDQTFTPSAQSHLQTRFDFSQFRNPVFGSTDTSTQSQLNSNLDYVTKWRAFDVELLATKFSQISGGTNSFSGGVERLPEFRLGTDAQRLAILRWLMPKTTHLDFSLGEFNEPSSKTQTNRIHLNVDLGNNTRQFNKRTSLDYGGSYQQSFYGDNTAQYVLAGRSGYRLKLGEKSSFHVNYSYLRPYGFTPFLFDFTGSTNTASVGMEYRETDKLQFTFGTAYDINRSQPIDGLPAAPWQNLNAQVLYAPSAVFRMLTNATYDINNSRLFDLSNTFRVRTRGGVALDVSSRYAPQDHRFAAINGNLDIPFSRDKSEDAGWRVRALGGYNGYTKSLTYQGVALTRSWHDWEGTLIYQSDPTGLRPGSTVTFNFRLKAFPAYEPFGVGQLGQSLDSGIGQIY